MTMVVMVVTFVLTSIACQRADGIVLCAARLCSCDAVHIMMMLILRRW